LYILEVITALLAVPPQAKPRQRERAPKSPTICAKSRTPTSTLDSDRTVIQFYSTYF